MSSRPFIRPDGLPVEQWISRLQSERADLMRQVRSAVHTSRSSGGLYKYIDRIDVAIAKATALPSQRGNTP